MNIRRSSAVTPFVGVWIEIGEKKKNSHSWSKSYYLKKNEIKKLQKNISSELLTSFGQQLTKTEDIKVEAVLN